MVAIYVILIRKGIMTIDQVKEEFKDEVIKLLEKDTKSGIN